MNRLLNNRRYEYYHVNCNISKIYIHYTFGRRDYIKEPYNKIGIEHFRKYVYLC
jgi:hypothetical protein